MTSPPVKATGMLCNCTWWWNHDLKSNKHIKVEEQFLWGWMFHFHVWKKTRWNKPITMQVEPLCKNICPTGNQQEKMRYLRKRIIGKSNGGLSENLLRGLEWAEDLKSKHKHNVSGIHLFPKAPRAGWARFREDPTSVGSMEVNGSSILLPCHLES